MEAARLTATIDADSKEGEEGLKRFHGWLEKSAGAMSNLISTAGGLALGGGILAGIAAIGGFLHDAVTEGAAANEGIAQTEAVLKSTGGTAGVTAGMVDQLSTRYMNLTGIQDDTVRSTENMLLTFTNIKDNVFPQATMTVLDMSVALGQDTKNSAIQLGKALNDPEKGITALQRVGVTFDKTQKDLIKTYMQHGDIASAQGVILKELNKEFGGSAEAAGKANGGIKILQAQFDNMKQSLGQAIIPLLVKVMEAVQPFTAWLGEHLPAAIDKVSGFISGNLSPILEKLGQWFTSDGLPALQRLGDFATTELLPALGQLGQWIMSSVVPALMTLGKWAGDHILPIIQTLAQVVIEDLLPSLKGVWDSIQSNLLPALQNLWDKISPTLIPAFHILGGYWKDVLGPAIGVLVNWLSFLVTGIGDVIGVVADVVRHAIEFGTAVWNLSQPIRELISAGLKPMWEQFKAGLDVLGQVKDWLADKLGPVFKATQLGIGLVATGAGEMASAVGDAVGKAIEFFRGLLHQALEVAASIPGPWQESAKAMLKTLDDQEREAKAKQDLMAADAKAAANAAKAAAIDAQIQQKQQTLANMQDQRDQLKAQLAGATDDATRAAIQQRLNVVEQLMQMDGQSLVQLNKLRDDITGAFTDADKQSMNALDGMRQHALAKWQQMEDDAANVKLGPTFTAGTQEYNGGRGVQHFASGGVIPEPVFGRGMYSGRPYSFGEEGPELVSGNRVYNARDTQRMLSGGGMGGGGTTVNIYPQKADLDADDLQYHLRRVALLGNTGGGY